jgi:short subunit dehydrogenase-like uncharacterized protein
MGYVTMKPSPAAVALGTDRGDRIVVFGAAGHTARFVVLELQRRGQSPILCGRDAAKLKDLESEYWKTEVRAASVDHPGSLDQALAGAAAVLNCAGPFADTAKPVIEAAMRAHIPYLDITAEPQAVLDAFEQFDAPARQPGIIVAPGLAFYGGFGDLFATAALGDWTAATASCDPSMIHRRPAIGIFPSRSASSLSSVCRSEK